MGITANSHKVIHNVIDRVEKWAEEKGISFRGLKAGRPDDPETTYSSAHVKTSNKDLDFINVAGKIIAYTLDNKLLRSDGNYIDLE